MKNALKDNEGDLHLLLVDIDTKLRQIMGDPVFFGMVLLTPEGSGFFSNFPKEHSTEMLDHVLGELNKHLDGVKKTQKGKNNG